MDLRHDEKQERPEKGTRVSKRKQAEAALRQIEANYRALMENSGSAVATHEMTFDESGRAIDYTFLSANPAFERFTGLRVEQILGRRVTELIPGIARTGLIERYGEVVRTGTPVSFEQFVEPLGRHYLVNAYRLDERRFAAVFVDITERKRIENALRDSELLLSRSQQIADVGSWMLDIRENHLTWSDQTYRIFGLSPQEFPATYQAFLQAVHPDDRTAVDDAYTRSLLGGQSSYEIEHRIVRPRTGETRIVLERCVHERDAAGEVVRSLGMVQDITDRKAAEAALAARDRALEESEARARAMLQAIPDLMFRMSRDGAFLDYKAAASELYVQQDLIGRRVVDLLPSDVAALIQSRIQAVIDTGEIQTFEYELPIPGAGLRAYEARMTASGADEVTAIVRDVTERNRMQAERQRLESELLQAQKMESVGRLAGGVAHDFNNMLLVILGHADLVLRELQPSDRFYEDLQAIRSAASRSADLTRQLLGFARRQTVAPKLLNLNASIEASLVMLRRLIGEDIALSWRPGEAGSWVRIDPSQVDQILTNLCLNARDAIRDVGVVTIETGIVEYDEANRRGRADATPGEYVRLTVTDNGSGMDAATLKHLFEPFFTTKPVGRGTGLGLATVYGIVRQNLGFVEVRSEPGAGTTFVIDLPRHPAPDRQGESGVGMTGRRGHEALLVVEDDKSLLELITKTLREQGYQVLAASNAVEAFAIAEEQPDEIRLLVTDVIMPEMNGRNLARQLLARHPHLKCLFISGYPSDVIANHGVLDEGVEFIQKPFSIEALGAKVRELLDR